MSQNKLLAPSILVLAVSIYFHGLGSADAATETVTSRAVQMNRVRIAYTDVASAPNTPDPGGTCGGFSKRVVVYTVPAGGQVNSVVTKVRTAFRGDGVSQVGTRALVAEQSGAQVSNGNIAVPHPDFLDTEYIENRDINAPEIAFYDEAAPWEVVAYVCGQDDSSLPMDISRLSDGSVDFYVQVTR